GHRQVVAAQPQGRQADQDAGQRREEDGGGQADRVGVAGQRQERRGVGADAEEGGVAEVEEPGEADHQVQRDREDRVDRHHGQEVGDHSFGSAAARVPKRPWGRTSSTATRMAYAMASCHTAGRSQTPRFSAIPMAKPPTSAPGTLPMPPRTTAAKAFTPMRMPTVGWRLASSARSVAASAASAEPRAKTAAMTRSVSM